MRDPKRVTRREEQQLHTHVARSAEHARRTLLFFSPGWLKSCRHANIQQQSLDKHPLGGRAGNKNFNAATPAAHRAMTLDQTFPDFATQLES